LSKVSILSCIADAYTTRFDRGKRIGRAHPEEFDQPDQSGQSNESLVKERMMSETVSLHEAKARLSALVDRAAAGEEIVIAKAGKPLAKLVPLPRPTEMRRPAGALGVRWISEDFDAPSPEELQRAFEGEDP
jgi:prevent-host-death family protein